MAIAPRARILFELLSVLLPAGDGGGGSTISTPKVDEAWGSGTGVRQVEDQFGDIRTLAGGANEDIDLQVVQNENGDAIALTAARLIVIQADPANGAGIRVSTDAAVTGFTAWLSSSGATDDPQLDIPPGGTEISIAPTTAHVVAAGAKTINIENLDGANPATYTIAVLGF